MAILTTCFIVLAIFVPVLGYPVGKRPTGDEWDEYVPYFDWNEWEEYVPYFDWNEWEEYFTSFDFDIKGLLKEIPFITIGSNFYINCLVTVLVLVKVMKELFKTGRMVLCCFPCYRKGQTSREFAGTLGRVLERPVSGWQGAWVDFGKLVGRVTPPIAWDFTPEQVFNPGEMARCLAEGCLSYDDPNTQFLALYWGLATAYRAAIDHYQRPRAEAESQTMSPETNDASIESKDIGIQTQLEVSTVSVESTECGTQTQPEVSAVSVKLTECGTQTQPEVSAVSVKLTECGTQTQPEVSAVSVKLTECGTQTQPEVSDVPVKSTECGTQTQSEVSAASVNSTEHGTQTQLEVNTISIKSIECGTQTQLEVNLAPAKFVETGVQTIDLMDTGTQTTTSNVKATTEMKTQTTNPRITIAPLTKKKIWIRDNAEATGLIPRLRRIKGEEEEEEGEEEEEEGEEEEEEEMGAKGLAIPMEPIPSSYVVVDEWTAAKEEEAAVRKGARPKELGARPKEKGAHLKGEGATAQMASKPPKTRLTPKYSLLDFPVEDTEEWLRPSSQGLKDYSLPPPRGLRQRSRSLSPLHAQSLPPRERGRERERAVPHRSIRKEVEMVPRRRDHYPGAEVVRTSEVLRTMTPAELRDLRRDYSRRPGEQILTWLVRCWDNGARSHLLEGQEAQQLGSLAQDREIEQEIARETYSLSLWLRILHAVREKYPFKEYLMSSPKKWTSAEEGIQYLRELAMLELIYCNPDYYDCLEPEKIPCTEPMWKQVIKGAPASYLHCLIAVYNPKMDEPSVDTMCSWIRTIAENMERSSDARHRPTHPKEAMEKPCEYVRYEDDYRDRDDIVCIDCKDYRDRPIKLFLPRFRPRSRSRSRSRSPSSARRRRGNPKRRSRNQLWSYLRRKGENMKKWDGEPTSKLEARVKELQQKENNKKVVYVVDADALQPLEHKKMEVRVDNTKKASKKAKSKSDDEYSDQDQ